LPRRLLLAASLLSSLWLTGVVAQAPPPYQVISSEGTRPLAVVRTTGSTDFVALDVVARFFELPIREDARTGGIVVSARGQRVVLTSGQATVSAGGRVISLSAPVTKDGATWLVPIDFLRVLAPLLERPIDIRRSSRLIVLGTASVPRLTPRFERTATGGRLVVGVEPAATARVTRDGSLVTVRFQADALDPGPLSGAPSDLITNLRTDGASLLIDLGPSVTGVRPDDGRDPSRVTIELIGGPAALPVQTDTPAAAPTIDRPGTIRTVVIDPGHGGSDIGSRSVSGLEEKQITLAVAQRLKSLLESRMGVRVVLTRDGDTDVAIDRRAAVANNNKADLFLSLHTNGSPMTSLRGWQVQSLDPDEYNTANVTDGFAAQAVPIVGGGTRVIDAVPWQLAQLPHVNRSLDLAQLLVTRLTEAGIPSHPTPHVQAPLRVLVGANMPAVLIELGFLTQVDDAEALGSVTFQASLAELLASVINEARTGLPSAGGGVR
jgi:N-acetylmuramoyl-L-alanine amidase